MKEKMSIQEKVSAGVKASVEEELRFKKKWTIRKYKSDESYKAGEDPFEVSEFEGNVALEEGKALLLDLLIGEAGTPYDNVNARLGVGESTVAEDSIHTGLQGATTAHVGMESGYPNRSGDSVTFRAVFDGATANHDWREFTVVNGADDTGTNLNRRVSNQGTKASGQTWTLDFTISIS